MNSSTLLRDFVATLSADQRAALLPIIRGKHAELQSGLRAGTEVLNRLYAEFDFAQELTLLLTQSDNTPGGRS